MVHAANRPPLKGTLHPRYPRFFFLNRGRGGRLGRDNGLEKTFGPSAQIFSRNFFLPGSAMPGAATDSKKCLGLRPKTFFLAIFFVPGTAVPGWAFDVSARRSAFRLDVRRFDSTFGASARRSALQLDVRRFGSTFGP